MSGGDGAIVADRDSSVRQRVQYLQLVVGIDATRRTTLCLAVGGLHERRPVLLDVPLSVLFHLPLAAPVADFDDGYFNGILGLAYGVIAVSFRRWQPCCAAGLPPRSRCVAASALLPVTVTRAGGQARDDAR